MDLARANWGKLADHT